MRDINPLNVLNQREVSMMPEHFTKIKHEIDYTSGRTHNDVVDDIKTWIFNNLDGRFTVTEYEKADNDNVWDEFDDDGFNSRMLGGLDYKVMVTIGFEQPEESTFFSLAYQG